MNENPKCHLHIPQPKKGIYVLNIIVQSIMEKRRIEVQRPQKNTKTLMPLTGVQKHDGGKNLEGNKPRETKQRTLWGCITRLTKCN